MKKLILMAIVLIANIGTAAVHADDRHYSVQLWSVRDRLDTDFEGTLKQLAAMGFEGVEFAGKYGGMEDNPKALKAMLDRLHLKATGAHVRYHNFSPEEAKKWRDFFLTIDCRYLINPMDERAWDPERIDEFVAEMNRLAKELKPYGLHIGYHNHYHEFAPFKGETFWDYIVQHVDKDVVLEMDVGWVNYAGYNPAEFMKKYPGRTPFVHYKGNLPENAPKTAKPFIGEDTINWPELITATKLYGGTQWYTVEQEDTPPGMTSLDALNRSFTGLKKVIATMDDN